MNIKNYFNSIIFRSLISLREYNKLLKGFLIFFYCNIFYLYLVSLKNIYLSSFKNLFFC